MMKRMIVIVCGLLFATHVVAADTQKYGTKEEALAMAERAAVLLKAERDNALKAFTEKAPGFSDKDLYVFALDKDGVFIAHGARAILVGKPSKEMADVSGHRFVEAFLAVKETGWVRYKWPDILDEGKIKDKSSYIIRVGEDVVGVGYYENP